MKARSKVSIIAVLAVLSNWTPTMAEESPHGGTTANSQTTEAVASIALAGELARYGKANKDPMALISAAHILKGAGAEDTNRAKETEGQQAATATAATSARKSTNETVREWLNLARGMADGKPEILAMADAEAKKLGTRGAFGGPKRTADTVRPGYRDVYRISFRGGEVAAIAVATDDASTLNMTVYDELATPICTDIDVGGRMMCKWIPLKGGNYVVKIGNPGNRPSDYVLVTN